MKSGIYIITDSINNRVYIGQSDNAKRRLQIHKLQLRKGIHKNVRLQRAFNANGDGFRFEILELCPESELDERERAWIAHYQSNQHENGYNVTDGGHKGAKWNEEARTARSGTGNPMFGHHHSPEFVYRIRMINRASSDKLTVDDVAEIKQALADGVSQTELSEKYNVVISTINKISRCDNWAWVREDLNDRIKNFEQEKKDARNQKMREMYLNGMTAKAIARELNCQAATVTANIRDLVDARQIEHERLKRDVAKDFFAGVPREEIIKKYGISKTSYVRYTTEAYNEKKRETIDKVIEMRKSGMMVKDIAKELNLHRTTVTEYCKKYGSW